MVEFPGDRVVPWQRFGPRSQFFMSTASKQRAEQLMAHGQVVENLQHLNQHRDRNGEQHNRLQ